MQVTLSRPFAAVLVSLAVLLLVLIIYYFAFGIKTEKHHGRKPNQLETMPTEKSDKGVNLDLADFETRRKHLLDRCQHRLGFNAETILQDNLKLGLGAASYLTAKEQLFYDFTFYDDNLKILFCTIPKVASTNVKKMFQQRLGRAEAIRNLENHEKIKRMNYTKILFVRNPLDRLISSWRDKFSYGYLPAHPELGRLAQFVINKYRLGQNTTYDPDDLFTWPLIDYQAVLKLEEFFRFLLAEGDNPKWQDVHWTPYVKHCDPCRVNYDYIGRFENFDKDIKAILKRITKQHLPIPKPDRESFASQGKTYSSIRKTYAADVPAQLLDKVSKLYDIDYDIFGYIK